MATADAAAILASPPHTASSSGTSAKPTPVRAVPDYAHASPRSAGSPAQASHAPHPESTGAMDAADLLLLPAHGRAGLQPPADPIPSAGDASRMATPSAAIATAAPGHSHGTERRLFAPASYKKARKIWEETCRSLNANGISTSLTAGGGGGGGDAHALMMNGNGSYGSSAGALAASLGPSLSGSLGRSLTRNSFLELSWMARSPHAFFGLPAGLGASAGLGPADSAAGHDAAAAGNSLAAGRSDPASFVRLEDRYCRDFACCGIQLENLHELLHHIEEHHVPDTDLSDEDDEDEEDERHAGGAGPTVVGGSRGGGGGGGHLGLPGVPTTGVAGGVPSGGARPPRYRHHTAPKACHGGSQTHRRHRGHDGDLSDHDDVLPFEFDTLDVEDRMTGLALHDHAGHRGAGLGGVNGAGSTGSGTSTGTGPPGSAGLPYAMSGGGSSSGGSGSGASTRRRARRRGATQTDSAHGVIDMTPWAPRHHSAISGLVAPDPLPFTFSDAMHMAPAQLSHAHGGGGTESAANSHLMYSLAHGGGGGGGGFTTAHPNAPAPLVPPPLRRAQSAFQVTRAPAASQMPAELAGYDADALSSLAALGYPGLAGYMVPNPVSHVGGTDLAGMGLGGLVGAGPAGAAGFVPGAPGISGIARQRQASLPGSVVLPTSAPTAAEASAASTASSVASAAPTASAASMANAAPRPASRPRAPRPAAPASTATPAMPSAPASTTPAAPGGTLLSYLSPAIIALRPYHCIYPRCDKDYKNGTGLKQHLLHVHGESPATVMRSLSICEAAIAVGAVTASAVLSAPDDGDVDEAAEAEAAAAAAAAPVADTDAEMDADDADDDDETVDESADAPPAADGAAVLAAAPLHDVALVGHTDAVVALAALQLAANTIATPALPSPADPAPKPTFACMLPRCTQRYRSVSGLKAHLENQHRARLRAQAVAQQRASAAAAAALRPFAPSPIDPVSGSHDATSPPPSSTVAAAAGGSPGAAAPSITVSAESPRAAPLPSAPSAALAAQATPTGGSLGVVAGKHQASSPLPAHFLNPRAKAATGASTESGKRRKW
ncbi:hypothetical protein CXG81DRAFT_26143 [Caulochytrium protostelioides]|uniref:C2H2-type domain-containing protein n=1 Tax=Caulochytrium protostelioides TaxID=1555241 RepID=A0A4P9X7G7_9FUNG|nr:hypothetical protein CXG81DRAFT_26143 [Caulochytrium protostelioides]|eukprot:RKP01175.1 hypothetical protein CXG81DRAFT_26143 [Caulochytrium protostelioides]